jgi:hypothetical protein
MGIYDTFKTDNKAEVEGVWKDFPPNRDGTVPRFLIARMSPSNPGYVKRVEAVAKQYKVEINLDIFTEAQAFEPMLDVFVDTILIGWEHVQDQHEKLIEYTKDNAKKVLRDLPDLYLLLRTYANQLTTFRSTELEANAGN